MARTPEKALMVEHEVAKNHANLYIVNLLSQIARRALIMNGAIQEFNSFLKLPAGSDSASAIWNFAFGALTTLVPALKLGPFIATAHGRAATALALAKHPRLVDKAKKRLTGAIIEGTEGGTKLKEYYDKIKPNVENLVKTYVPEADSLEEHSSRKPIFDLIQELDAAKKLWEDAVTAELQEWINRVDELEPGYVGPLDQMMANLLPPLPSSYTAEELNEIWRLYLWLMVGEHCTRKVKWVKKGYDKNFYLEGLNDTQKDQIVKWFGDSVKRGKYFNRPPLGWLYPVGQFLSYFPIKEEVIPPYLPSRVA